MGIFWLIFKRFDSSHPHHEHSISSTFFQSTFPGYDTLRPYHDTEEAEIQEEVAHGIAGYASASDDYAEK
jgi:hypothetical protein